MTVKILTLTGLGPLQNLLYVIADMENQLAMVVDPAWDSKAINDCLKQHQLNLCAILLTHTHYDHISCITDFEKLEVPIYLSKTEYGLGFLGKVSNLRPRFVSDGEQITLGGSVISVIETPGHTIGSLCFHVNNHLIAGDTLFIDGCGRCDFPESDVRQMFDSLQKLKQLSEDTIVYCGHDYGGKQTDTLGNQKKTNPYLIIDDKDFFVRFRMELQKHYRSIPFQPSSHQEMQKIIKSSQMS